MDFLPQVSSENLNEGDLQCGDLAMHENPSQIKLHLETDIHLKDRNILFSVPFPIEEKIDYSAYIGSVNGGRPPKCESTIGDLIETRPLGIS